MKPDYALVHKHIASIYALEQCNRPDLMAHHLHKTLELDPEQADDPQLRNILAQIDKQTSAAPGVPTGDGAGSSPLSSPPPEGSLPER